MTKVKFKITRLVRNQFDFSLKAQKLVFAGWKTFKSHQRFRSSSSRSGAWKSIKFHWNVCCPLACGLLFISLSNKRHKQRSRANNSLLFFMFAAIESIFVIGTDRCCVPRGRSSIHPSRSIISLCFHSVRSQQSNAAVSLLLENTKNLPSSEASSLGDGNNRPFVIEKKLKLLTYCLFGIPIMSLLWRWKKI